MDERVRFVADVQRGLFPFSEPRERFGISRKTGYKWLGRYEMEGPAVLEDSAVTLFLRL